MAKLDVVKMEGLEGFDRFVNDNFIHNLLRILMIENEKKKVNKS